MTHSIGHAGMVSHFKPNSCWVNLVIIQPFANISMFATVKDMQLRIRDNFSQNFETL